MTDMCLFTCLNFALGILFLGWCVFIKAWTQIKDKVKCSVHDMGDGMGVGAFPLSMASLFAHMCSRPMDF